MHIMFQASREGNGDMEDLSEGQYETRLLHTIYSERG